MSLLTKVRCDDTVLVVDDISANRDMLGSMLTSFGFRVLQACDGEEAVALYDKYRPWLVVMDVYMPGMDGIEATRQIKALAGNLFVPILFVTGSQDESLIDRCIDIGGDDFIHRPYSCAVLRSKLKSMQRFSKLYYELHDIHAVLKREEEFADRLLNGAIEGGNIALDKIVIHKQPAAVFCGDVHLTAYRPNGTINVLLGDFTGHGFSSVIGSLPLAESFRAMTRKGFSGDEILCQINRKLHTLLPVDMFLAAVLVTLNRDEGQAYIWNCGMPDVYVLSNDHHDEVFKYCVSSADPPLGIVKDFIPTGGDVLPVADTDQILLMSDGVLDARNRYGEMFGRVRAEAALVKGHEADQIADTLMAAVEEFTVACEQDDDISVIELPCSLQAPDDLQAMLKSHDEESYPIAQGNGQWTWSLELRGQSLKTVNPVPMILSQLQEIQGSDRGWQSVFTILTELYVNALDHGVLGLDSSLKASAHGFSRYFSERELKLNALTEGYVRIWIQCTPLVKGGSLIISLNDSGSGFDYKHWLESKECEDPDDDLSALLSGRGIRLVSMLADELRYSKNGSAVEVKYRWQEPD